MYVYVQPWPQNKYSIVDLFGTYYCKVLRYLDTKTQLHKKQPTFF